MTKDQEEWATFRVMDQQAKRLQAEADKFRSTADIYKKWEGTPCPPSVPAPVCTCVVNPLVYCHYCGN